MWILIVTIISSILTKSCSGLKLIDIPIPEEETQSHPYIERRHIDVQQYPPTRNNPPEINIMQFRTEIEGNAAENQKDESIKSKIKTLVQQTLHDTQRRVKSLDNLKNSYKDGAPYKIGFILSMIKKARDVLNELFNVAVKHRDDWKALEQLKIFEMIVHTNVDTTNLVRQLVEIHIQHMNNTSTHKKTRVVLL